MAKTPTYSEIQHRWETRVLPNGWHCQGGNGANAYLKKYGKNISWEKKKAIADYARNQGYSDFADAMAGVASSPVLHKPPAPKPDPEFKLIGSEAVSTPLLYAFEESKDYTDKILIETDSKYLSKLKVLFKGWGSVSVWSEIYKAIPKLQVRIFLGLKGIAGSGNEVWEAIGADIWVNDEFDADRISEISRFGTHVLNHSFYEKGWTYFEA